MNNLPKGQKYVNEMPIQSQVLLRDTIDEALQKLLPHSSKSAEDGITTIATYCLIILEPRKDGNTTSTTWTNFNPVLLSKILKALGTVVEDNVDKLDGRKLPGMPLELEAP